MHLKNNWPVLPAIILILVTTLGVGAQQPVSSDKPTEVIPLASSSQVSRLLPDSLAGLKATGDTRQITSDNLRELVPDQEAVNKEYLVTSAASRDYGGVRVDVFETQNQFGAFGLFTFNTGATNGGPILVEAGSGGARVNGALVFWKGNVFVRVSDQKAAHRSSAIHEALARVIANAIVSKSSVTRPPLLDSLPAASKAANSERYVLGPESLKALVPHGGELFVFEGDTEAVIADYIQPPGSNADAAPPPASDGGAPTHVSTGNPTPPAAYSPVQLLILECHTPQFATDALAHATSFVSSLPETEQQRIIVKRTGNYIVAAINVSDREFAEGLIGSVQYPYTVKWLRNPLWPTNDPFRTQKAAEMLLSTFGLLGLILGTVLVVGSIFGTTIFLKRRKRQQEIFSDAGGMLRLDLDPFESVILGLPPKRSEE
ncbi:MAG: DUF6599 family protein [Blastocatellia bacterium]